MWFLYLKDATTTESDKSKEKTMPNQNRFVLKRLAHSLPYFLNDLAPISHDPLNQI